MWSVFVADSQYEAASSNLEMLHDLEEILSDRGMCLGGRGGSGAATYPYCLFLQQEGLNRYYARAVHGHDFWTAILASTTVFRRGHDRENVVQAVNVAAALALKKLEAKIYGPENQTAPIEADE